MKKSSAKSTCKPLHHVLVGFSQCFDISDPKDELKILTKIFKRQCQLGWYTEPDGSWAAYAPIRHNKSMQEAYNKAIAGDVEGLRSIVCQAWKIHAVKDSNAPINL